jgi:hypothetical protein
MNHDFGADIEWFVDHVGSIRRMLPPFAHIASTYTKTVVADYEKFIEQHATDKVLDAEGNLKEYAFPPEMVNRHRILTRAMDDSGIFTGLLPKMALVNLVSIYDAYLGRLIRGLFQVKPEILNASNRQLTFAQLAEFPSLNAARDHIIEAEVESVLRDSHTAQFEWLEGKLGISLRKELSAWPCFIELTERRNLFVHADGVVGAQYLSVCNRNGVVLGKDSSLGATLRVPPEYFKTVCDCLTEIGVKLGQVLWRKIQPESIEAADEALANVTFDLLALREYAFAETLLIFATQTLPRHASAELVLIFKVNLAIAYKWQAKNEDCQRLLNSVDWSALSDKFQLAAAVLRDEYDRAAQIMRRIGQSSRPNKAEYRDWPLFRDFRKSDQFKQAFQEVFSEPFRLLHTSASRSESLESAPVATSTITET